MIKRPTVVAAKKPATLAKPGTVAKPASKPGKPSNGADLTAALAASVEPVKRRPGRPAGSKNKPADEPQETASAQLAPPHPMRAPNATQQAAAKPPVDREKAEAEFRKLRGALDDANSKIQALTETVAKLRAKPTNVRTISEIVENAPVLPNGPHPDTKKIGPDWRQEYHGANITIKAAYFAKDGDDDSLVIRDDMYVPVMLAIPRDNDVGGIGSACRADGRMAVHWEQSEDGTSYFGTPLYLRFDQLLACWAE